MQSNVVLLPESYFLSPPKMIFSFGNWRAGISTSLLSNFRSHSRKAAMLSFMPYRRRLNSCKRLIRAAGLRRVCSETALMPLQKRNHFYIDGCSCLFGLKAIDVPVIRAHLVGVAGGTAQFRNQQNLLLSAAAQILKLAFRYQQRLIGVLDVDVVTLRQLNRS